MTNDSSENPLSGELAGDLGTSWRRFLERCEPLRPELYRYCRYLARSPWDAEDLVQDTLARGFVTLACLHQEIESPRAWLFRVASNLWLNRVRGTRETPRELDETAAESADRRASREAAGTLIGRLAPQERAAVVLKDVFDFRLEEIADALSTTVGAVKAALSRGRGKLEEPEPEPVAVPTPAVLDAFCEAFNARDLDRLTSLLLDTVVVESPGLSVEYGIPAARGGSLSGVLFGDPSKGGGIPAQFRAGVLPRPPRLELRVHRGEPLMLGWFVHEDGEAVRAIARVQVDGEKIARLRTTMHAPEILGEICRELGVPFRTTGYRYWG